MLMANCLASLLLLCGPLRWHSSTVRCAGVEAPTPAENDATIEMVPSVDVKSESEKQEAIVVNNGQKTPYLKVEHSPAMQPTVSVKIGGQMLPMVLDVSSGNTAVFVGELGACVPRSSKECYSYAQAKLDGSVHICSENAKGMLCDYWRGTPYKCTEPFMNQPIGSVKSQPDELIIDGVKYSQEGVEALDSASVQVEGTGQIFDWNAMPVRLLTKAISPDSFETPLKLFENTAGILGASGPTLGCRNQTLWATLLKRLDVKHFALDFQPPRQAKFFDPEQDESRVTFGMPDRAVVWSQPKQTGDITNDGIHEFLIYRPSVCGVDMLYNTSSNWLVLIDTSGPCLSLPPFLFDRLMTRLPVKCPFESGAAARGRLCSPDRKFEGSPEVTLPALEFALEDDQEPAPPKVSLPLERLVFTVDSTKQEFLCVSRADSPEMSDTADMTISHIAFGSLVVSAFYTAVNLDNFTIGLAPKTTGKTESTDQYCVPSVACQSSMQTYFPPLNICEDPDCSEYMLLVLDPSTKMCRWSRMVPVLFGLALSSLFVLDIVSHKLYKQAIERATEFCQ